MGWLEEAGKGSTEEIIKELRCRLFAALMVFPPVPMSVEEDEDGGLGIMDGKGTAIFFVLTDTEEEGIQLRYTAPVCLAPQRNQRTVYQLLLKELMGRCFVRFQLRGDLLSLEGGLPAHALDDTTVLYAATEAFLCAKSFMQHLVQFHGLRPWHGDESEPDSSMRDFWSVPLPPGRDGGVNPLEKERLDILAAMRRGKVFDRMRLASTLILHLRWMDMNGDDGPSEDAAPEHPDRVVSFRYGDIRELLDADPEMDPELRVGLEAALAAGEPIECDLSELDGECNVDRLIENALVRDDDDAEDFDPGHDDWLDAVAGEGFQDGADDDGEMGEENWDDGDILPPLGGDPRLEKALITQLVALLKDFENFDDFTVLRQSRRTFVLRHGGFALLTTFLPGPRGTVSLMCHTEICALTGPPSEALLRALLDAAFYPLPVKVCLQETTVGVCAHLSIRHLTDETARHLLLSAFELAEKLHDELTLLHGLKSLRNPGYPASDPQDNGQNGQV